MDNNDVIKMDKDIDKMVSAEEFKNKDISRLILIIEQKLVGGDLEIQCGETATYSDLLFSILCLFDSLSKDNKNIGTVEKIIDDMLSMYKSDEFHKND